jgi:hypothetical protein
MQFPQAEQAAVYHPCARSSGLGVCFFFLCFIPVLVAHGVKGTARTARPQQRASPSVITVFSAPNYLNMYNNKGAAIKYVSAHP